MNLVDERFSVSGLSVSGVGVAIQVALCLVVLAGHLVYANTPICQTAGTNTGWGWEDGGTCIVQAPTHQKVVATSAISASNFTIQAFEGTDVDPFENTAVLPFEATAIELFKNTAIEPFEDKAIEPFESATIMAFRNTAIEPFENTAVQPFEDVVIEPFVETVLLQQR